MIKRFFRRLCWYARELWRDTKEDILVWMRRKQPRPKLKSISFPEMAQMLDEAWSQPIHDRLQEPSRFEQFISAQQEVNEAIAKAMEKNEQEAVKQVL